MKKSDYILNDLDDIPIVGWYGPDGELIRPEIMAHMAEAGFNVSISSPQPGKELDALEIAYEAGVKLIVRSDVFDLERKTRAEGTGYQLTATEKERVRELVNRIKDHEGLFGYYIHDEPLHADYDWVAAMIREIESIDSYHICYANHNAPVIQGGYGAGTQEALWRDWIAKTSPKYLSYDHYCIEQKPKDRAALLPGEANVYGDIVVKPNYYACLDFARKFSVILGLPLWAFTCGTAHWSYPFPTEGHLRFQLMCDLAYGARGLQYFQYVGDKAPVTASGERTGTWHKAKTVNAEVRRLWEHLKGLRSIGVHHTGPIWPGTTLPMGSPHDVWGGEWKDDWLATQFTCEGDPMVVGVFDDPDRNMYLLIVNKDPVDGGSFSLRPELNDLVPYKWIPMRPGEGKLFRIRNGEQPVELA